MKTAIVIGSTGLVGSQLVQTLLSSPNYHKIHSFSRRTTGISHSKLHEHLVDFDKIDEWKSEIKGDDLYSCMGTTIKKAGSKEAQYKIDYSYQYEFAKTACEQQVKRYALVSSTGADSSSRFFYLKTKGELEDAVLKLPFEKNCILRPSVLDGQRKEFRFGEKIGIGLMRTLGKLPIIEKYRPTLDKHVAQAMVKCLNSPGKGEMFLSWDEIEEYLNY